MSKMLPSFARAFNSAGRSKAAIARGAGVSDQALRNWLDGVNLVPVHKRELLEAAFGSPIDWPQVCADYMLAQDAKNAAKEAPQAPKLQAAGIAPRQTPARPPAAKPIAPPAQAKKAPRVSKFLGLTIIHDDED